MSFGNTFENEVWEHIFNNAAIANVGDAGGLQPSDADGYLYVSLHTANPDETGNQTTSECAYPQYARIGVPRDGTGWLVDNNTVSPADDIDFDEKASGGNETATHFAIGTAASGSGKIIVYGTLTPNILIQNGTIPRIKSTSTITLD